MGRKIVVYDTNPIWWHLGRIVQIQNTWVWETHDCAGIVLFGYSSEEDRTWLSLMDEYNGEKKYRARFTNQEFWGQKRKLWKERRGKESGDTTVYEDFLEIVVNRSTTGSVLKVTIAVSVTILWSVQKWHSLIFLRIFSCGRMREMRREPEVPEGRVPVAGCLNGPSRITWKELAPIHVAPYRMLVLQDQEWLSVWRKVLIRTPPGWWTTL